MKTLIVIPEGHKYVEVISTEAIKVKVIKDISKGSNFESVYLDEYLEWCLAERQKREELIKIAKKYLESEE